MGLEGRAVVQLLMPVSSSFCGTIAPHRGLLTLFHLPPTLAHAAHYWAAQGAINLAMLLMSGAEGPTFEVAEVSRLLDDAEREYKLSRCAAHSAACVFGH